MKRLLIISILAFSALTCCAQHIERVSPQFSGNKAADQMIQYICDNLRIVIPAGKDLSTLNTQMRCKITINEVGDIVDIIITKHTVVWLELCLVDGLKEIHAPQEWNVEVAEQLQKELVFSFGNWRKTNNEYGMDVKNITNNIQQKIEEDRKAEASKKQEENKAWSKVTSDDLKVEMPLSPERGKNPNPEMKPQQIQTPEKEIVKNIEFSIE